MVSCTGGCYHLPDTGKLRRSGTPNNVDTRGSGGWISVQPFRRGALSIS